jgi:hypothetical protein
VRFLGAAVDVRSRVGFGLMSGATAFGLAVGAVTLQRATALAEAQPGWGVLPRVLVEAVLTGLAAPLVQMALRRLDALFGAEEPDLIG